MNRLFLFLTLFLFTAPLSAQYYPELKWPLLKKAEVIDTNSVAYAKANVKASMDSVKYPYYKSSYKVTPPIGYRSSKKTIERTYSREGYVTSEKIIHPEKKYMFSDVYAYNKQGRIIHHEYSSAMDTVLEHYTIDVLACDAQDRPLRVLETYPLVNASRTTTLPASKNSAVSEYIKSKGVLFYSPTQFSQVLKIYTYRGDSQIVVLRKEMMGKDTVQTEETIYNKRGYALQVRRWIYPNAQTRATAFYKDRKLIETQTFTASKKTEHTVYTYPKEDEIGGRNIYNAYSLLSGKEVLICGIVNNYDDYIVTPVNQAPVKVAKSAAERVIQGAVVEEGEPHISIEKTIEDNQIRYRYYNGSYLRKTIWTDLNGLFLKQEDPNEVIWRTYTY